MDINNLYSAFLKSKAVNTDTRSIQPGDMFFALKGGNFDGNQYAENALEKGALYAIIDNLEFKKDERYLVVDDVLTALQTLANYYRKQFSIPFIAITGSNGKTTTKELLQRVLSKKYKTFATKGNLNNHIGIPLTLLSMPHDTEMAVIEMGANHQKEIEGYCKIVEPTHGTITNIGKAHLEGFGGIEGVKKGKGELFDYLRANGRTAFVNSKDVTVSSLADWENVIYYPAEKDFYNCELITADPFVVLRTEKGEVVKTKLIGAYNFENMACALCVGKYFEVPDKDANDAIATYDPTNNRSQVIIKGSNTILLDAYNANPSSMKAAIEHFAKTEFANKVLILGDMFELGDESEAEHGALGKLVSELKFSKVILVGKNMIAASRTSDKTMYFENKTTLQEWLKENILKDSHILIKGSRGMGLETLLEDIKS
jgi:UDP-N-acetylmuramoyl-tripeptide--D-alanyl-D-alanine ligase